MNSFFNTCRLICLGETPDFSGSEQFSYDQKQGIGALVLAHNMPECYQAILTQTGWFLAYMSEPARREELALVLREHARSVVLGILERWKTLDGQLARRQYWETVALFARSDTLGHAKALGILLDVSDASAYWRFGTDEDDLFGPTDGRDILLSHVGNLARFDRMEPVMMIWDRAVLRKTGIDDLQLMQTVATQLRSLEDLDDLYLYTAWQDRAESILQDAIKYNECFQWSVSNLDKVLPMRKLWQQKIRMEEEWIENFGYLKASQNSPEEGFPEGNSKSKKEREDEEGESEGERGSGGGHGDRNKEGHKKDKKQRKI